MKLTPQAVTDIFRDCLFREEEPTANYVEAHGLRTNVGFHPERLEAHKSTIGELLAELPDQFKKSTEGGGWSFLNMCEDKHGNLWTGEHQVMDELVCLGLATKQLEFCAPRSLWQALPQGMPYVVVNQ